MVFVEPCLQPAAVRRHVSHACTCHRLNMHTCVRTYMHTCVPHANRTVHHSQHAAWTAAHTLQLQPSLHSHTFLSGTLPSEWSRQSRLTVIDVSQNQLDGTLPEAWGPALVNLQLLDASGNGQLSGTLPESWGSMGALQVL